MSFLNFVEGPPSPSGKTRTWFVETGQQHFRLGEIKWYAPWRRYTFAPVLGCLVFDAKCLTEIASFLDEQMSARANVSLTKT